MFLYYPHRFLIVSSSIAHRFDEETMKMQRTSEEENIVSLRRYYEYLTEIRRLINIYNQILLNSIDL